MTALLKKIDNSESEKERASSYPVLSLVPSDYKDQLQELGLPEGEAAELLEVLWDIAGQIVDASWGLDLVQKFTAANDNFSGADSGDSATNRRDQDTPIKKNAA